MSQKQTYTYEGREVEGESVEFTSSGEQWANYQLNDGSSMKVKLVMLDVVRLDAYNANGDPIYLFNAQQVIGVTPNVSLKKKVN